MDNAALTQRDTGQTKRKQARLPNSAKCLVSRTAPSLTLTHSNKTTKCNEQDAALTNLLPAGGAFEGKDPADTSDMPSGGTFTINYDLGNQFHVEKLYADGSRIGRHGYVDPLGILRVSYYSSGPNGLDQRQESRWVGSRHAYAS
ncbi:hypothetical protein E2C01_033192 [Portunus trituberculatus]|uniref:Uncharacterized protein n=1 Tax=Portunus trituberculatus TaxID=210409 RepID=A0A5B7F2C8_PORTR|nr:hypothetical protein [Portunus trituberculatus]